jgi:alpha-L-fucosidase
MLNLVRRYWLGGAKLAVIGSAMVIGAIVFSTAGAPPARADLQNPRQSWLRESQAGLFLHWGMRTSPVFSSCTAWENAVNNTSQPGGRWEASKWVTAAERLHAKYIVLAAFHSRLGYARAWPSRIPGSCSTKRDYLGELIEAAHARGLKVINYMTDDPSHHNENGPEYLDSGAYSRFKGRTINITTRDGFGEFSYENFFEVMRNHPTLDGFWIDNDNAFWERNNLYRQIHQMHPNMLLSNNNEDTPEMDTVSNEQKTGMTPSYDYPQAVWTAAPRLIEADYKLPTSGSWWFSSGNFTVDRKLTIGRFVTNAGSSIKSLMAETAMVNGDFPSNQSSFNTFFDGWVGPIWEAFDKTEGGGYMYGGLQPGRWNDGAYGVTTIKQGNANLHYIHVIDRPSGSTLRLRDNGYRVTRVTNLRTRGAVSFSQSRGVITLTGVSSWDQFDTVFRVETSGRVGIYAASSVASSATASRGGFPATNLTDGSYLNYWDNNGRMPVTITLDLGSAKRVEWLGINQREWSVSYARSATEQSARIRSYTLQVSTNGTTWTTVRTATMPSARGVQLIDVNVASARFVRVVVNSTWAASSATKFFHQLRIDEMVVGGSYA